MREARADLGELVDQLRSGLGDPLHVAAVARMQHPSGDLRARASSHRVAISGRLRSISA